jgi:hypothetical protein
MAGTQNPVRMLKGTDQESDGEQTKFLEPPTGLAPVPDPSMLLTCKMLVRLRQDPRPQALDMLIEWAHPWRRLEINNDSVASIAMSNDDEALDMLQELRNCRTF